MTTSSSPAQCPPPAPPARSAWKARTTSWPTATSSSSGSTSEYPPASPSIVAELLGRGGALRFDCCDKCVELAADLGSGQMVEVVTGVDDLTVSYPKHEDRRQCERLAGVGVGSLVL